MISCAVPVSYKGDSGRRELAFVRRTTRNLAMSVALRWPDQTPTVAEIRQVFGLSRASAYRYLAELKQAKEGRPDGAR